MVELQLQRMLLMWCVCFFFFCISPLKLLQRIWEKYRCNFTIPNFLFKTPDTICNRGQIHHFSTTINFYEVLCVQWTVLIQTKVLDCYGLCNGFDWSFEEKDEIKTIVNWNKCTQIKIQFHWLRTATPQHYHSWFDEYVAILSIVFLIISLF